MSRIDGITIASNKSRLARGARMAEYAEQQRERFDDTDEYRATTLEGAFVLVLILAVVTVVGMFV